MSNEVAQSLTIYGNLKIDRIEKLEMLMKTLPQWLDYWGARAFLRLRGSLADEGADFARNLAGIECHVGAEFHQWRWQAQHDLEHVSTPYVFQYLEDHIPSSSAPPPLQVIDDLIRCDIDVLQYSWFQSYERQRTLLRKLGAREGSTTQSITLEWRSIPELRKQDPLYFVSLPSIFRRDFYLRVLRSPRPWIRRFDPVTPFDVEQRPPSAWLMPMTYACVKSELGICLDDDLLAPGSSAIARGLFVPTQSNGGRVYDHHAHASVRRCLNAVITRADKRLHGTLLHPLPVALRKSLTLADILKYTAKAPVLRVRDKKRTSF